MPNLDAIAGEIGAQLAALVAPMIGKLELELEGKLAAATVSSAAIVGDELVLTFGDGSTRNLGRVVGVDGHDGLDGQDGAPAEVDALTARIAELEGKLAASAVKGGLIDRDGELVLTFGDGSTRAVGRVVGHDGQDGAPGAPGLGLEDLDVSVGEDGRTLILTFERAELAETFELELPVVIYRGVFDAERAYRPGDCVSFGGSAWVCNAPTSARPGGGDEWTLAVKRGRDGKDVAGPTRIREVA